MSKRFSGKILKIFSLAVFGIVLFSFTSPMLLPLGYPQKQNATIVPAATSQGLIVGNYIRVQAFIELSDGYYLYDSNTNKVNVTINMNFTTPPTQRYQIVIRILFSVTIVVAPQNATFVYGFWGYPPIGTLTFDMPGNVSTSEIRLEGNIDGNSVLFRNTAEIPILLTIDSPVGYVSSFKLALVQPPSSKILTVYSPEHPSLTVQSEQSGGQRLVVVSTVYPGVHFLVLYEHELWAPVMITLFVVAILVLIAFPFLISRNRGKLKSQFKHLPERTRVLLNRVLSLVRRIEKRLLGLKATDLLSVYMAFALLILSVSLVMGPDPRLKVYVLSSTVGVTDGVKNVVEGNLGGTAITVFDEMSEFPTLTNLGVFTAVVIADFHPPSDEVLKGFIYPGFDSLPGHYNSIIIMEQYADTSFADEVKNRYPNQVVEVSDFASLETTLSRLPMRTGLLGFNVDSTLFLRITAFLGLLSLVLVFFGLAFLSIKLIEIGRQPSSFGLFETIAYSTFVFLFTEAVYIVAGVLLATPLGLHAGGARITAVGLLGFQAGSTPRMLAGFFGFLFGALISLKEGVKISRIGLATLVVILFFIVVDPLTSGLIFYEFILLFGAGPYSFETSATTTYYFKDFLASIGVGLGGWVSPTLLISTGIILFYMGAVPFFLFPRLRKNTATVMLFFCAFSAGSGVIRVSNMRPWDAFMSMLPGIMAGLVAALIFLSFSFAEKFVKAKLERGGLV